MAAGNTRVAQMAFGRLNENENAQDGDIAVMENISVEEFPLLKNSPTRYKRQGYASSDGIPTISLLGTDGKKLFWIANKALYYDGTKLFEGIDANSYAVMNQWVMFAPLGFLVNVKTAKVKQLFGQEGQPDAFPVGVQFLCTVNNRMWGCTTDGKIYASKLGDPSVWLTFENLSTDPWSIDMSVAVNEPFTGCAVLNSRPVFFTETKAVTIYGDYPSTFSTYTDEVYGVMEGCHNSVAEINGYLYYLSRWGFVRYNSGGSTVISDNLKCKPVRYVPPAPSDPPGLETYEWGVLPCSAGTDGRVYFASARASETAWNNYTYDTQTGLWAKEDAKRFTQFCRIGRELYALSNAQSDFIYYLRGDATIGRLNAMRFTQDKPSGFSYRIAFAPIFEDRDDPLARKWLKFLRFRVRMVEGMNMRLSVYYDSSQDIPGMVGTYRANVSGWQLVEFPVQNGNCDSYRIQLEFDAPFRLRAASREYEILR